MDAELAALKQERLTAKQPPPPVLPKDRELDEIERKVYDIVAKRFLPVFYPAAQFEVTTRITRVEDEPFKTEGKILRSGRLAVNLRPRRQDPINAALVAVRENETVKTSEIEGRGLGTRPPRFTEATLLSAMEGAGKLVEDEELREAMAARGLARRDRAAIIEGPAGRGISPARRPRDQLHPQGDGR